MAKKKTTIQAKQNRSPQLKDTSPRPGNPQRIKVSQRKSTFRCKNNILIWGGAALLVLLVAVSAIYLGSQQNSPAVEALPAEISVVEAYQKYEQGSFVLDVRTPEEWDTYHAPGTTLIPLDELGARLGDLPRDEEIVVVCRSGNRSADGRDILLKAGFEQVTSMAGGLNAWRSAGYRLEEENP